MTKEEGFTLVNKRDNRMYFANNGSSTIDLIFYKGTAVEITDHRVIYSATETPIKKHCPVTATFKIKGLKGTKQGNNHTMHISRKIDENILRENKDKLAVFENKIQEKDIDAAALALEDIIRTATSTTTERRAKRWFNKRCYMERKRVLLALHTAKRTHNQEDLNTYSRLRKEYKNLLRKTRDDFTELEANRLVEEAKENPYIALKPRKAQAMGKIEMHVWEEHFSNILNQQGATAAHETTTGQYHSNIKRFTTEEIRNTIPALKNKKAPGPDGIYNEHIKAAPDVILPALTNLLNLCLHAGNIPATWRTSTIRMLYKGKGDPHDPNSYRGIALENNLLKLLTRLMNRRLTEEIDNKIPEEQFGFRRGRSTLHAVKNLIDDVEERIRLPQGKFHAVFVDFSKAFDSLNRTVICSKLDQMVEQNKELAVLAHNILSYNSIIISDNVTTSKEIMQTNGVLQGDPLIPLLFNVATHDVVQTSL